MSITTTLLRSRVVEALASPHGVDRYLEIVNPMWAAREVRARIVDIRREVDVPGHPPVATVTLQPTSTWDGHRAGQHVELSVDLPGAKRATRVFTISSSDSKRGERFTVTVRANPDGQVSKFLVEQATIGTIVHLSQAKGEFVLPDRVPEHIVFITGGSGITPAMSMLRSLQKRTHRGRVTFLHYAQSPKHQIFADELADVRTTGYGVDVHLLHPELGDPALTPMFLEKLIPNFGDVETWACGPAPLIEAVQAAYDGSDALRVEYFKPPKAGRAIEGGQAVGEILFARSGRSVPNTGEPILVQAEAAGLTPQSGCRMGICFSCPTRTTGTVRNVLTGETISLPDEEVRICVSAPEGDCSVDL